MLKYKICIAGAKNVGKSSLLKRYCEGTFADGSMDTIGVAFKRKTISYKNKINIELTIWDFGGEEKYRNLFPSYVKGVKGALILFDITRKETLEDVKNWVQILNEHADSDIERILIGAKCDLEKDRKVPKDESSKYCEECNFSCGYVETSAKDAINVDKAFYMIAEKIVQNSMQECKSCGELITKKLKICRKCGQKL
jgi:small GTP-binding protein